jgi:hypothetical protein
MSKSIYESLNSKIDKVIINNKSITNLNYSPSSSNKEQGHAPKQ